ncbi:ribonuclease H-like domain-containing protein [Spirochaetota bacterium]
MKNQKASEIKYLVFDVESVPDPRLILKTRYPHEELSDEEAVRKYQGEMLETTDGRSSFIPVTYQYPISICVAKVLSDFTLEDIVCLDEPHFRTSEMVKLFWRGVEDIYKNASLVTFNGRGFDLPLLELMAFRYGFQAKRHFTDKFAGRFRFGPKHIDLQDWLSNYNAIRMNGGLDLLAKIIGKPGKMGTSGDKVYEMFLNGEIRKINDYCVHDVLDTYFVFLRTRVMTGQISIEREQDIVRFTKEFLMDSREKIPALEEYIENWGDWEPWP